MGGGAWWATVHGVAKSRTRLSDFTFTFHFHFFSYLGRAVSLQGCSSKVQPLLLTLDEGYLFTATVPDLQRVIAPLGPPAPVQPLIFLAAAPGLGRGVAPPGHGL